MSGYRIQAQVVRVKDGWRNSIGLLTFVLETGVLGLVSAEHAAEVAERMIRELAPDAEVFLSVANLDDCITS